MNTWISLISVCIALAAVIVGPIVSWNIAKRQVVSPMRQQWINDLRSRIADLMSTSHHFFVAWPGGALPEGEEMELETHKRMLFLYREIELMLNPEEQDHQALLKLLQKISFKINYKDTVKDYPSIMGETTALAQKIFKSEWIRVKRGS